VTLAFAGGASTASTSLARSEEKQGGEGREVLTIDVSLDPFEEGGEGREVLTINVLLAPFEEAVVFLVESRED
jgi:hypothetical protein